ncbi:MAG: polysaccharide pyruvyl transferase family protein [Rhodococcus sp. (in: high G+C Gram-positive bacteria)]
MSPVALPALPAAASTSDLIYLIAPSGHPNYGDEFILRAWLRFLARVRPGSDVVVDCHSPGQAAVLHTGAHPRAMFVDTVWRICHESSELPPNEALDFASRVMHDPGILCRLVSGIELLARANVVHLLGGGYVNSVWPHHLALLAVAAAAVDRSGGLLVATGQGLAPVGDADRSRMLRSLLDRFDIVDVRDDISAEAVGSAAAGSVERVSHTGDDAWLGLGDDGVYDTESEASDRDVVLCLQIDLMEDFGSGRGVDGLSAVMADLIDSHGIAGRDVAVVEGIPGADRVVYDRIAHLVPGAIFVPFTEVWNRGLPARAGQTWISTRFHPHLIASAAGAGGLVVEGKQGYYTVKHRSLMDAGSRWRPLDPVAESTEWPPCHGFSPDVVQRLREVKTELAQRIYPPEHKPEISVSTRVRTVARAVRRRVPGV